MVAGELRKNPVTGDYVATVEALLGAGARAPKLTDDLEASELVRDLLRRHAEVV